MYAMSHTFEIIYDKIKNENKKSNKTGMIFLTIIVVSFVLTIIGAVVKANAVMMMGILISSITAFAALISLAASADASANLKGSLNTLEQTGCMKYLNEILNKEYAQSNNICLSKHLLYIKMPMSCIIAYEDIVTVTYIVNKRYFNVTTVDGKSHRVKMSQTEMKAFLGRHKHILRQASYSELKPIFDAFKNEGRKILVEKNN